jgi:Domain of unknown function (DUF5655)
MRASMPSSTARGELPPLWRCPKCGAKLVTANMWHSCGIFSIETLFARSDPRVLTLFKTFERLVRSVGPVILIPQKTRAVFMVRVRFAAVYPRKSSLICSLGLPKRAQHRNLVRFEKYADHFQGHYFRIQEERDFDSAFKKLIRLSYRVGEQRSLQKRRTRNPIA